MDTIFESFKSKMDFRNDDGRFNVFDEKEDDSFRFEVVELRNISDRSGDVSYRVFCPGNIEVTTPDSLMGLQGELEALFGDMLNNVRQAYGLQEYDRMQVVISDPPLEANSSWRSATGHTPQSLFFLVMKAQTSAEAFNLCRARFRFIWGVAPELRGGAYFETARSFNEFAKSKTCVVVVPGCNENDCFWECLALGIAFDTPEWVSVRSNYAERRKRVLVLQGAHAPVVNKRQLPELEVEFEINIYIIEYVSKKFLVRSTQDYGRSLFLLYNKSSDGLGHFHFINPKKVGAIWNKRQFCFKCLKGFRSRHLHGCIPRCLGCKKSDCGGSGKPLETLTNECGSCHLKVYDADCIT